MSMSVAIIHDNVGPFYSIVARVHILQCEVTHCVHAHTVLSTRLATSECARVRRSIKEGRETKRGIISVNLFITFLKLLLNLFHIYNVIFALLYCVSQAA